MKKGWIDGKHVDSNPIQFFAQDCRVIKRGKKWQKKIPIQILGNPISPLSSPEGAMRYLREDEYPPPPKRGTPMRDALWKLCLKEDEMEENFTKNENYKRGKHGRRLSIYNSNKEVEGPACFFCCNWGLIYYSARKYCCEIRDESDSDEASKSEATPSENIESVIKQELEVPLSVDNEYAEETKCKMVDQGKYHERKFQPELLRFAEQLMSGVFLIFKVASSPLQEDKEAVSLQRFFYNYLKRTRLRLGIKCEEDRRSSDSSSSDKKTDEESGGAKGNNSNDDKQDNTQCDAFMDQNKNCAQNPICGNCVKKGKLLSVALLDALSKPMDEMSGSTS